MLIKVTLRTLRTVISTLVLMMTFVMVTTLRTASPVILMILMIPTLILILMMMKMVQMEKEKQIQENKHQLRVSSQQLRRQLKIFLNNQSKPEKIIKIL